VEVCGNRHGRCPAPGAVRYRRGRHRGVSPRGRYADGGGGSEAYSSADAIAQGLGGTLQPAVVTRATVRAIDRDQRLVIPGILAKLTAWQFRLIPGVSHWVIRRIILWMNRRNAA